MQQSMYLTVFVGVMMTEWFTVKHLVLAISLTNCTFLSMIEAVMLLIHKDQFH